MGRFSGVITPMVTPFNRDADQTINYDAAAQLIDKLIDGGVAGIFIFGSNGEFHVVNAEEKAALTKFTVERVAGRVPVYVGTGCCSTRETIELSRMAEQAGADALSVINPYFIQPSDDELFGHYEAVAASVKIPVMLYNIPKTTGKNLSRDLVARLAKIDNVKGIKDSSGNMDNLQDYLDAAEGNDVDVLVGSDSKISAAIKMGATGAIAGTSNLITKVVVDLYDATVAGDEDRMASLQADIEPIRDVLHLGTVPSMLKRAVELSGIPVGPARMPVADYDPANDKAVIAMLEHYQIPVVG